MDAVPVWKVADLIVEHFSLAMDGLATLDYLARQPAHYPVARAGRAREIRLMTHQNGMIANVFLLKTRNALRLCVYLSVLNVCCVVMGPGGDPCLLPCITQTLHKQQPGHYMPSSAEKGS